MSNQVLRLYLIGVSLSTLILLGGLNVSAQTPSPSPSPSPQTSSNRHLERDFFKNILSDQKVPAQGTALAQIVQAFDQAAGHAFEDVVIRVLTAEPES